MHNQSRILPDFRKIEKQSDSCSRLRFWETDDFFSCPIAGICLSVSEQKQLLRKAGFCLKKTGHSKMHEILVSSSKNENRLSRKIDSLLSRKFSRESELFGNMTETELEEQWQTCLDTGEYIGMFWYLASRPNLSKEFRRKVFGDIHMSMHIGSQERADMIRRSLRLEEQIRKSAEKAVEEIGKRKVLQKEVESLQKARDELKGSLEASEKQRILLEIRLEESGLYAEIKVLKAELEALKKENRKLKAEQTKISEKAALFAKQVIALETEKKQSAADLMRRKELEINFQKEIQKIMNQLSGIKGCNQSCPSFDLCKKRVLIVGGVSKMESLYRQVIEQSGGIFEYHDGHVKGGVSRLECSFKRADIVLCPVNCNSHAACTIVRQLGKKHNKPVRMLSGSGLNAVFRGIRIPERAETANEVSVPAETI